MDEWISRRQEAVIDDTLQKGEREIEGAKEKRKSLYLLTDSS